MPNDPLALARAAARRVLRPTPLISATNPAPKPVTVETVARGPMPRLSEPFNPPFRPPLGLGPPRAPAIKQGARVEALRPELTRIYGVVADAWAQAGAPDPVITSGNDGRHRRDSRHYRDLALDLRGNNIDGETARRIRDDLQSRVGDDYQVIYETFPREPRRNHIHVEYDPPRRR